MIFLYAMPDVYGKAIDREYIIYVLEVGGNHGVAAFMIMFLHSK
jgi:hypothetical protein